MNYEVLKSHLGVLTKALWESVKDCSFVVIGLAGDLGAGKTTLVKYFAGHLGLEGEVSSPSYSIENEYVSKIHKVKIRHVDCYRGLHASDIEQIFSQHDEDFHEIVIIEWINLINIELPSPYIILSISIPAEDFIDKRFITIDGDSQIVEKFIAKYAENS